MHIILWLLLSLAILFLYDIFQVLVCIVLVEKEGADAAAALV